jgi:DNA-binding transcriptional LysR family regulator
MELHHLRYFVIVAEEHNFTRAAERLSITQPPLSQQIRNLEDELGFQLFDRSRRQLELTPAGLLFYKRALKILAQVDQTIEGAKRISKGEPERLTIGYVNFAFYTTPLQTTPLELLQTFQMQFPDVELVLHELLTAEQVEALNNSEIDLGIAIMPVKDENLAFEIIVQDKFQILLPADHRLAQEEVIDLEDLADESFILHPHNIKSEFHNKILHIFQQAGFRPKVSQEVIQLNSVVKMVAARMGIALVPSCTQNISNAGVVFRDINQKEINRGVTEVDLGLVWRKRDSSRLVQALIKMVKDLKSSTIEETPERLN